MSDSPVRNRAILLTVIALLIVGCDLSSTPTGGSTDSKEKVAGRKNVTFYVAGMNQDLKIL